MKAKFRSLNDMAAYLDGLAQTCREKDGSVSDSMILDVLAILTREIIQLKAEATE